MYRSNDANTCRDNATDDWTSIRYDIHHAHNQPYEQGVIGLHAEENHHSRYNHHQDQTLGQNTRKIARQKHRDGVQCASDVTMQTLWE